MNFGSNFALVEARGALVGARGAFRGGFEAILHRFWVNFGFENMDRTNKYKQGSRHPRNTVSIANRVRNIEAKRSRSFRPVLNQV